MPGGPAVAAIIVNFRTADLTIDCLASLRAARDEGVALTAVAVDGGSGDGSAEAIDAAIAGNGWGDWARGLPLPVNGGFGYANNQAILSLGDAPPPFILLVNPDARVLPGAIPAMLALMAREPECGAVGGLLVHEDGGRQGSAFHFPGIAGEFFRGLNTDAIRRLARRPATTIEAETARPVPWVTGAAVMFRTEALKRTGLFDDGFFLYFEETELMARLSAAGWTVWHDPAARFVHLGGRATNIRDASSGLMLPKRLPKYWYEARRRYFVRTHGRAYAVAAGAAFLAGRALWLARCAVQRKADTQPQRTSRDIAAHSLWPIPADTRAAPPSVGGAPGGDPAWMRR